MKDKFFIIDGHSLIYRYWFAPFADLISPDGEPTKATYLFTRMLFKLAENHKPGYLAVAFDDKSASLIRRKVYSEYKANRKPRPPEIEIQTKRIKQICRALGICTLCVPGCEADDVIATLATQCVSNHVHIAIVGKDKDLAALLADPRIRLYNPTTSQFTNDVRFQELKGYRPQQGEDLLTLMGDALDNIPPIGGIGKKTATELLARYDSLSGMLEKLVELPERARKSLASALKDGTLGRNMKLARLCRNVQLNVSNKSLEFNGLNEDNALEIFRELGFRKGFLL